MTRTVIVAAAIALALTSSAARAQGGTEIYAAPLSPWGTSVRLGAAVNITRRAGYDNQPAFTRDGRGVLYTSQRKGQTDIYRFDFATDSSVRITKTAESEYSPTLLPDGSGFSVIRVELDSTQRLWSFRQDGSGATLVLRNVKPVGYHAWANSRQLVLFVLGNPPTLQRASTITGQSDTIVKNPGRSIHHIPGKQAVSFVEKKGADDWWIRALDMNTGALSDLVRTLPNSEDYAWTPSGIVLMAQGNTLYSWNSLKPDGWQVVRRFKDPGLQSIKRLAVSPDGKRVAMVSDEQE